MQVGGEIDINKRRALITGSLKLLCVDSTSVVDMNRLAYSETVNHQLTARFLVQIERENQKNVTLNHQ